jgi:hypothetical protein
MGSVVAAGYGLLAVTTYSVHCTEYTVLVLRKTNINQIALPAELRTSGELTTAASMCSPAPQYSVHSPFPPKRQRMAPTLEGLNFLGGLRSQTLRALLIYLE